MQLYTLPFCTRPFFPMETISSQHISSSPALHPLLPLNTPVNTHRFQESRSNLFIYGWKYFQPSRAPSTTPPPIIFQYCLHVYNRKAQGRWKEIFHPLLNANWILENLVEASCWPSPTSSLPFRSRWSDCRVSFHEKGE